MYTLNGTLTTKPTPVLRPVNILQKTIQTLDTKQCNFYEAFRTSDNSPLIVYPGRQLSATVIRPYIDCSLWERAAASVFKSSVIFMTADKRGVQLDCHALNKRITLFVQWKEVGVQKPDESHFELYLGFLKDGLLKHHFKTIVSQPNKVRKAIFKAIDAISSGLYSCYEIAKGIKIETGFYGGWNILKEDEVRARSVCLEQITTGIYNL